MGWLIYSEFCYFQDSLPLPVVAALDRLKTAFTYKSGDAIAKEIQLFYLHHDDVLTFLAQQ